MKHHNSRARLSFNDERVRGILVQIAVSLFVLAVIGFVAYNTATNLAKQGIASGFDFLSATSGFQVIQSVISFSEASSYGRAFFVGLINTIMVSAIGIVFATILGFIIGVARLSSNWMIAKIATVYIESIRNIPLLLQIFFAYFVVLRALPHPRQSVSFFDQIFINNRGIYMPTPVPETGFGLVALATLFALVFGGVFNWYNKRYQERTGKLLPSFRISVAVLIIVPTIAFFAMGQPLSFDIPSLRGFNFRGGFSIIPEMAALVAALSLYTASFIAEIVRAGIESVSKGQKEAAMALGLNPAQSLRLVIIPQAMRVIVPPLTSQYLNLTKNSSLAAAIGYPDLVSVFAGTVLNQTGQAVEVILITMLVYLTISLSISMVMNIYNRRTLLRER